MNRFAKNCVGASHQARRWARPLPVTFGLLALLISCPRPAFATDQTWTGTTSTDWNTAGNWNTAIPAATDNAVFNSTFTNQPNLGTNKTAGGIWMTGSIGQNVAISGASTLTLNGNTINGTAGLGILIDNANARTLTITAPVTIGAAQIWRNNSGNVFTVGAGGVNLNGKAFTIDGTGNTTVTGVMSGAGAFTKAGTGVLTLNGTNTYTGTTTVSAGILNIRKAAALGATGSGTTVSSGATLQMQGGITVGAEALTISGTGASGQTGALVNVSGTNNYGGLLTLGAAAKISSDGGTLNLTNAGTITGATFGLTLAGAGNGTVSSIIGTTSGTLAKNGAGTWTLSGTNTYTGLTSVNAGTLAYGASNVIGTGKVTVNGATAVLALGASHTDTVGIVTVAGGGSITGTGTSALTSTGTFEMQNGSVSAILAGSGTAMNKTTAGTVTLTGANTFTGNTTVSAGTLAANADGALGSTAKVTINTGGTVLLGMTAGNNRISDIAEVALAGGTLNTGGFSETVGKMTLSGNSTLDLGAGTSHVIFDGVSSLGASTLSVLNWTGTQGSGGGTDQLLFSNSSFTAGSSTFQIQFNVGGTFYAAQFANAGANTVEAFAGLTPVPEPGTLYATGALLLAIAWRERKRLALPFRQA